MRTRSSLWDARVAESHTIKVQVDILSGGVVILENVAVASGEVILDRTAAVRGRCMIDLAEPLTVPNGPGDPLSPFGFEVSVRRGITYTNGTTEMMPLGVFGIQRSSVSGQSLVSSIDGLDRGQRAADARLEDDYVIVAGTNMATAIQALIDAGVPGLTYAFASTTYTTGSLIVAAQSDRWAKAVDMARSIGCELFFDGLGVCVLRPTPTAPATPDWTLTEGAAGVLVDVSLSLDRAPAYNKVIATSSATDLATAVSGSALDNTPSSPTYYYGAFGRKPRFYSSPLLTTTAQCTSAATALLADSQGVAKSISFGAVPNPAVEPGDSVRIVRSALGIDEMHVIDTLRTPLTASGVMSGNTRQVSA